MIVSAPVANIASNKYIVLSHEELVQNTTINTIITKLDYK